MLCSLRNMEDGMSRSVTLAVNGRTDIGQVREENEDAITWFAHPDQPFAYVVVADGMGGYSGGSLASRIAIETLSLCFSQLITPTFLACTPEQQKLMIQAAVRSGIHKANHSIINAKSENPDFSHMGTTVVLTVVWRDQLTVAHVGDSRAYLWSLKGLAQLTRDHSVVQEMIDAGTLTEEEARTSDVRNHITRALGVHEDVDPDVNTYRLTDNALLMLCSDGLTEYFDNAQLQHVLATHRPALECCYRLIDDANHSGGRDNISVGLMEVTLGANQSQQQAVHFSVPAGSGEDTTVRRNIGVRTSDSE